MQRLTIALGVWAAAGPLVGILFGHFLTRSWQHKQWMLDCRKEEFRELIASLTSVAIAIVIYKEARDANSARAKDCLHAILDKQHEVYNVIASRIYIAKDIKDLKIMDRYIALSQELRESTGEHDPSDRMSQLVDDIVKAAVRF
jgi:hypothetical protein